MQWLNDGLVLLGACMIADGLGSALVKGGQYHSFWYDAERYARAAAGVAIIVLSLVSGGVL